MRFEIRRLHDEFKITTVYVTHDQSEAMVTSDRIVVMNKGRIEQIDAPHVLYARPKSRFVAGFIGRTNFLEGSAAGQRRRASTVSRPPPRASKAPTERAACSIRCARRPSDSPRRSPTAALLAVEAEIAGRSYLGEYWDYQVRPLGAAKPLRVSTGPERGFRDRQPRLAGDRSRGHGPRRLASGCQRATRKPMLLAALSGVLAWRAATR